MPGQVLLGLIGGIFFSPGSAVLVQVRVMMGRVFASLHVARVFVEGRWGRDWGGSRDCRGFRDDGGIWMGEVCSELRPGSTVVGSKPRDDPDSMITGSDPSVLSSGKFGSS